LPGRDWFRLVRAPLAPTAACDAVACALLARGPGVAGAATPPTVLDLLLLAATSALVYGAGMAGNDLADRRRDETIHPDRPLPARRIGVPAAVALVVLLAAGAVALGGGPLGDRRAVVAALAFAALYDGVLKRSVALGAVAMGLVRAANASSGVLALVVSGAASPIALAGPALVGLYASSVTVLSTAEEQPSREPARRRLACAVATVVFLGAAALAVVGADGLVFAAFPAFAIASSAAFGRVPRKGPVKRQVLEMLLGLYWLDAVLACGGAKGSDWGLALGAFAGAYALILLSQLAIRALR